MNKINHFCGREYGVLPRFLQFIIFINQGLYRGGVGLKGWIRCWKWNKLLRIKCWYGNHKWFKHTLIDRQDCIRCGEQVKYKKNCICVNIKNWDGKQIKCTTGYNDYLGFNLCDEHLKVIHRGEITLSKLIEEKNKND